MMLKQSFEAWKLKSDLAKLQYGYAFVVLVTLVIAGLIGLLNQEVSRLILSIAGVATLVFFVNLVSFAVINLFLGSGSSNSIVIDSKLNKKR